MKPIIPQDSGKYNRNAGFILSKSYASAQDQSETGGCLSFTQDETRPPDYS
jgi:hypothetical protein